ncbi:MAG: site-2 protease family protein [Clostridia bacterium]|nr:site-2 protease family protein [Clostridia bacterium]
MGIIDILFTDLSTTMMIIMLVAWLIAVMIAIIPHEFAHAFVAYKMGDDTAKLSGRMTFNPKAHFDPIGAICLIVFGFGWAKGVPVNSLRFRNMRKGQICVSLAGVVTNIILGIIFTIFYTLSVMFLDASVGFYFFLQMLLSYTAILNFVLAVFNFIPIYPLDGFNFVNAFLQPYNKFERFMQQYGIIFLLIFILTPLSDWVINGFLSITFYPLFDLVLLIFS